MAAGMPKMPPLRFLLSLSMFRDDVPHPLRFWSIILMAFFFQLSGAVYVASITQIVGDLAYISQDVTFVSYCSFIGLNMVFPMMFRWKFGLFTRQMWFVAAGVVAGTAVVAMYATNPWVLAGACLLGGYFKMMGMFQCMSSIQLNITPTRNFGAFFPVIYLLVFGSAQLSGIMSTWLDYIGDWRLMYGIVVILMSGVVAIVYFAMKPDHRSGPYIPIKGIDWTGQLLWTGACVAVTYIFNYGARYDWWNSYQIWNATWVFLALLIAALLRMKQKGDGAYIVAKAFCQPVTWWLWVLMFGIAVISATGHELVPKYVGAVLQADSLRAINLNWPTFWGIVAGAILSYYILVRLKWGLKSFFFTAFIMAFMYTATMYFVITPQTSLLTLYPAVFCLGAAEVMMETGVTYAMSQRTPFPVFFMNITIAGFVRCGPGTAAGAAIMEHLFDHSAEEWGMLQGIRETFGYCAWIAVAVMVFILLTRFRRVPVSLLPRMITVAKGLRRG